LAQLVRKGKLDAALVALPLNTEGLHHPCRIEPLIAALPASWPEATAELTLSSIIGRCSGLASVIPIF
jgi:DNA-binding transcriptional LysR family regulator